LNSKITGLHHITAIASDPKRNFDFYTKVLGMRFVKKSVNQDDPGTYHLYYGDYAASPSTILTFFPWIGIAQGRPGTGQAYATGFSVPFGSLAFWRERLNAFGVPHGSTETRFNDEVLPFNDPDGLHLELVATNEDDLRPAVPSADISSPFAIRGFHSSTLALKNSEPTAELLTHGMGYLLAGQVGHRTRYTVGAGGPGTYVDLLTDLPRGINGAGTIHHVAFRVIDDDSQTAALSHLQGLGTSVSPVIDRAYFKSIYYREPGGVLFEIATDGPGFAIDEPVEALGTKLSLPPRLESQRATIAAALPPLA
jgi:glyoxalase family protein